MTWLSNKLRKWLGKEKQYVTFKPEVDIPAVYEFLASIDHEVAELTKLTRELRELIKEQAVVTDDHREENMRKQVLIFDIILNEYQYFQDDADINGNRLKALRKYYLQFVEQKNPKLHSEWMKEPRWTEDW